MVTISGEYHCRSPVALKYQSDPRSEKKTGKKCVPVVQIGSLPDRVIAMSKSAPFLVELVTEHQVPLTPVVDRKVSIGIFGRVFVDEHQVAGCRGGLSTGVGCPGVVFLCRRLLRLVFRGEGNCHTIIGYSLTYVYLKGADSTYDTAITVAAKMAMPPMVRVRRVRKEPFGLAWLF